MNTITIRTGTEGPRFDPYHFTEVTVRGRAGEVTYHGGLGEWTRINKEICGREQQAAKVFELATGLSPYVAEKVARLLPYRKHARKCSGRETTYEAGYPGETLEFCAKCGQVVNGFFDRSAIE